LFVNTQGMAYPELTSLAARRVLITGAASGIGRATAQRAAAQGALLVLTDRDAGGLAAVTDEIRAAGGTVVLAHAADVSDLEQVQALAQAADGPVDVVMNIAGISAWGTVDNLSHEHWRSMVEVNLMGPIHVIETFVPPMVAAGRGGWLVNVSSAAGLIGLPWHAAYSASKFGLRGVSEVLRFDLRQHGIGVSLVCPGGVATPLTNTVEVAGVDQQHPAFRRLHARFVRRAVTPELVADAILRGLRRHKYLVYTSSDIRALHLLQRYVPAAYNLAMRTFNTAMTRAVRPALVAS
jgi:NAD(P)-dependent dehydrogenase (short-subunit alcohol dehydrogenase family)